MPTFITSAAAPLRHLPAPTLPRPWYVTAVMKLLMMLFTSVSLFVAVGNTANETKEGEPLKLDTKAARIVLESNKFGVSDVEVLTT